MQAQTSRIVVLVTSAPVYQPLVAYFARGSVCLWHCTHRRCGERSLSGRADAHMDTLSSASVSISCQDTGPMFCCEQDTHTHTYTHTHRETETERDQYKKLNECNIARAVADAQHVAAASGRGRADRSLHSAETTPPSTCCEQRVPMMKH